MKRALALLLPNLFAASLCAQVGQFPGTSVPLASTWQQSIAVPAGNTPTLLNFAVDAPPAGQDTIDVLVVDPNVVISLILPAGTEINASNATANGFVFSTNTIAGVGADLTPFSIGGIHTIIQLPIPAQTGVYSVKADATNATADTAMVVWYYPSSTVALGAATDAPTYRQGDLVILSGLLFDGSTPIQNATVTAIAGTFLPVSGTVGNYQLVSTTQLDSTYSLYTYTAQFTNSGAAVNNVGATVAATDPNMVMVMDGVAFGTVPAGVPVTSAGTFSFIYPTATAYDLATLQWAVQVPDTPINVTLQDSGTYDYATGDGIYTGTLTPSDPGNYIVQISASGTSASGLPFVRTASTTFQVIVASAQIGAFSDAPTTDPTSGLITSVNITASVNVQIAGQYQLSLQLTASNGQSIPVGTMTQLNTGTGQILLSVSASEFLQLGVGGPYTIDNASLVLLTSTDAVQEDYQDPAGTTQAYTLASFSRGPLYFTGQNSASGANTSGGTLFSALDVQAGVGLSFPSQGQINCNWGATLTDGSGNEIAMTTGSGQLSNGNQTINFNFDGNLIGQSGASSFIVSNAFISCNGANANADPLMQIQGFTPSQFTNVPPDFTLSAPDFSIVPGASATIQLTLSGVGSFSDVVNFSVTGLPAGFTSSFGTNVLGGPGINFLTVTAPTGAALGTTTITIAYATSSVSKTLSIPMTVVSQAIAVSVSPANPIVPGAGTQQFFAVVANTSNQSVTWSLSTPLGTIDSNGLYAAPSSISAQQTVTVIATSAADASVTGGTTIYLSPLGGPWLDQDVGTVGTAGNASIASGVFMVQGAGVSLADNTPTNVGFNFLYQLADGNAGIVARIVSSTGVASVMMLNSLTAYASYAFVSINQAGSATFCYLGSSGLQCGTPTAVSLGTPSRS